MVVGRTNLPPNIPYMPPSVTVYYEYLSYIMFKVETSPMHLHLNKASTT